MPRLYYSEQKALYACWFDNSFFVVMAPGLHDHETESHIFYSENAVKKYLEENGYHKLVTDNPTHKNDTRAERRSP